MLGWMHENELHRGFLELPTGEPFTPQDIALKIGRSIDEVNPLLGEMRRIGIFSSDDRGCIFSRRMARETHISQVRRDAAKSRADRANRAANGSFAGNFGGAKLPAKELQNPTVSDSVSTTTHQEYSGIQDYTANDDAQPPFLLAQTDFPKTLAAVCSRFPAADVILVGRIVEACAKAWLSVDHPKIPEPNDDVYAEAVQAASDQSKKQTSAALYTRTVPTVIENWAKHGKRNGNNPPRLMFK